LNLISHVVLRNQHRGVDQSCVGLIIIIIILLFLLLLITVIALMMVISLDNRSFAAAGPRLWNILPGPLC